MAYPLDDSSGGNGKPEPSYYVHNQNVAGAGLNHFYAGDIVRLGWEETGVNLVRVYDIYGNLFMQQAVNPAATSVSLGVISQCGYFRARYFGPITGDTWYGDSYGGGHFTVMPSDSRFVLQNLPGNGAPGKHGNPPFFTARAWLGIPSDRMQMNIDPTNNVMDGSQNDSVPVIMLDAPIAVQSWTNPPQDTAKSPNRPRYNLSAFSPVPGRSWDTLDNGWALFYPATTPVPGGNGSSVAANADKLFIQTGAGTAGGTSRVQVFYPNNTTRVEDHDNLLSGFDAEVKINAISQYIVVFGETGGVAPTMAPTSPGIVHLNGVAAMSSNLVPLGVTHFDGPRNEPDLDDRTMAQNSKAWAAGLKAGTPHAFAMAPCAERLDKNWPLFFANGGHIGLDGICTHIYDGNTPNITANRDSIESWFALKNRYCPDLPVWQTEAYNVPAADPAGPFGYGLFNPLNYAKLCQIAILFEQYDIPIERQPYWYDFSLGFWSYAAFLWTTTIQPMPSTIIQRGYAAEVFDKQFSYRLDMGSEAGNAIAVGSVYKGGTNSLSESVAAFASTCEIPGATITLNVVGLNNGDHVDVVDYAGNVTPTAVSGGKITIPLHSLSTYVELAAGVTVNVDSMFDWGANPNPSISRAATTFTLGGVSHAELCDDLLYSVQSSVAANGDVTDDAILLFPSNIVADRVVIFCPVPEDTNSCIIRFNVDTTVNGGTSWTTQKPVDTTANAASIMHGVSSNDIGTRFETFWTRQRIFSESFNAPITCNGVRIHVTRTSYGTSPDLQAAHVNAASTSVQQAAFEEIMVISGSTPVVSFAAPVNTGLPVIKGETGMGTIAYCHPGTYSGGINKRTYQWLRDGVTIVGDTKAEHLISAADHSHELDCIETASNLGGSISVHTGAIRIG
jgi:hypothetical protein